MLRCAGDASRLVPLLELFTDALREDCIAARPDALVGHPALEAALTALAPIDEALATTDDDAILCAAGKAIQAAVHLSSTAGSPAEGAWQLAIHLLTEVCVGFLPHILIAQPLCDCLASVRPSPRLHHVS